MQEALRLIDLKLQLHGKTNDQLNLPPSKHRQTEYERMKDSFNPGNEASFADYHETLLTSEQRHIYNTVVNAVKSGPSRPFMVDAPAGTGKTFT